jgi:hypothetical protein
MLIYIYNIFDMQNSIQLSLIINSMILPSKHVSKIGL